MGAPGRLFGGDNRDLQVGIVNTAAVDRVFTPVVAVQHVADAVMQAQIVEAGNAQLQRLARTGRELYDHTGHHADESQVPLPDPDMPESWLLPVL